MGFLLVSVGYLPEDRSLEVAVLSSLVEDHQPNLGAVL